MIAVLDDGPEFRIDISGGFSAGDDAGLSAATAGVEFQSDGDVHSIIAAGSTKAGEWVMPRAAAPLRAFEIMAHQNSGAALDGSSAALDTWHALSGNRAWSVTQIGAGSKSANLTVSIRFAGHVFGTGTVNLSAVAV